MARTTAVAKNPADLVPRYRVSTGKGFHLADFDPADTAGLPKSFKPRAQAMLERGIEELSDLQEKLYAQDRWSMLLVFQALDAAGKDSTIKHVFSGVNPQGCQVHSFKAPSADELDHDYLWRTAVRLPARGRLGIFNRSYYEEVLVVRVHRDLLAKQRLPTELVSGDIWRHRYEDIAAFERHLTRNGTRILKFFLLVSKDEQRKRFLERLDEPQKNWKFSAADVDERRHWNEYLRAYEDAIRATATKHCPWYVVPADNKWFTRLVVAATIVETLKEMDLRYPQLDAEKRRALVAARSALLAENRGFGSQAKRRAWKRRSRR